MLSDSEDGRAESPTKRPATRLSLAPAESPVKKRKRISGTHRCACEVEDCNEGRLQNIVIGGTKFEMNCLINLPGASSNAWKNFDVNDIDEPLTQSELEAKGFPDFAARKVVWSVNAASQLLEQQGNESNAEFTRRCYRAAHREKFHRQHMPLHGFSLSQRAVNFGFSLVDNNTGAASVRTPAEIRRGAAARTTDATQSRFYPPTALEQQGVSSLSSPLPSAETGDGETEDGELADDELEVEEEPEPDEELEKKLDEIRATLLEMVGEAYGDLGADTVERTVDAAVAAVRSKGKVGNKFGYQFLKDNPDMVPELTMFRSFESFDAWFDHHDQQGAFSNARVLRADVFAKKRQDDVPLGQSPGRKRKFKPSPRKWDGRDAFAAANWLLRTGGTMARGAKLFGVSYSTFCVNVFTTIWIWAWIAMSRFDPKLYTKERVKNRSPPAYKTQFGGRVDSIIDCYPIYTFLASRRWLRRALYNKYYGTPAVKGILGCTPYGSCKFLSDLYCARITDEDLFDACGMIDTLPPGSDVIADKGFYISRQLFARGCGLVQPVEKPRKKRFSRKALLYSRRVSRKRIHVERWVRRLQARCGFFRRRVPLNQLALAYPVVQICKMMGNYMTPIR